MWLRVVQPGVGVANEKLLAYLKLSSEDVE